MTAATRSEAAGPGLPAELVAEARRLGAATVHEAAGRIGALPSAIKPVQPRWRLAGPAFPVATTPANNVWIHDAIYAAPAGSVLVVDCGGHHEAGYWGEIMSTAALQQGLAGLVIDACVRDADDLGVVDLPVFAAGLCIQGTTKERSPRGTVGVPVRIGAVIVRPGDLVVGDVDGVVVIPGTDAGAVIDRAAQRADAELAICERLRAGERTLDIYDLVEREGD